VSEIKIRELEQGALNPITGSADIDNETVTFWDKSIHEVIEHRLKSENEHRGKEYFAAQGYDSADVIFGGDHGARRFRAVIRLIFRNSKNNAVPIVYQLS